MQRTSVIIAAFVILAALAVPALGVGPDWPSAGPPPHGHMLVLDSGACVDLAANQILPRNAHHEHAHVGDAGGALRDAGHSVVPAIRWANCEAFLADLAD